jgi:hypothetical protein
MESGDPRREESGSTYGGYEGQQSFYEPTYRTYPPPPPSGSTFDDNLAEAIAQRVAQILSNQNSNEKVHTQTSKRDRPSAGQRLALAIVSLALLIPIGGTLVGPLGAVGLFGFSVACLVVLLVNVVFNIAFR